MKNIEDSNIHHNQSSSLSLAEWTSMCHTKDPLQLIEMLPHATLHTDPIYWREKLHALIKALQQPHLLELAANKLSLEQLHEILHWASLKHHGLPPDRLPPLFYAMPHPLFYGLVARVSPEQLDILRRIASAEGFEHHIAILSRDIKDRFNRMCSQLEKAAEIARTLDFEAAEPDDVKSIDSMFEDIQHQAKEILHMTARALALAWNTKRIDIIQDLSRTKELAQHCLHTDIGARATADTPATGLWTLLKPMP